MTTENLNLFSTGTGPPLHMQVGPIRNNKTRKRLPKKDNSQNQITLLTKEDIFPEHLSPKAAEERKKKEEQRLKAQQFAERKANGLFFHPFHSGEEVAKNHPFPNQLKALEEYLKYTKGVFKHYDKGKNLVTAVQQCLSAQEELYKMEALAGDFYEFQPALQNFQICVGEARQCYKLLRPSLWGSQNRWKALWLEPLFRLLFWNLQSLGFACNIAKDAYEPLAQEDPVFWGWYNMYQKWPSPRYLVGLGIAHMGEDWAYRLPLTKSELDMRYKAPILTTNGNYKASHLSTRRIQTLLQAFGPI